MNRARRSCQGWTILELMIVLFVISILAVIALPTYFNYQVRAKIANEIGQAAPMKTAITEHYLTSASWATSNAELDFQSGEAYRTKYLKGIEIGDQPVPGAITLYYSIDALPQLGEKSTLVFYPIEQNGGVIWACDAGTLAERYRPSECR